MPKPKNINIRFRTPSFSLGNFYKIIDGKKYRPNGTVPKMMEDDLRKTFQRHGLVLRVEPDEYDREMIKLWSRRR